MDWMITRIRQEEEWVSIINQIGMIPSIHYPPTSKALYELAPEKGKAPY